MKTLLLVTKPLGAVSETLLALVFAQATEIVLAQNGVYNTFEALVDKGFGGSKEDVFALEPDVSGRRINSGAVLVGYDGIVTAIARNDKVITL